jgi:hypothetical protein
MSQTLYAVAAAQNQDAMALWVAVIAALGGTLLGGLINYCLTAQRQKYDERLEKRRRLTAKLEEAYQAAEFHWQIMNEGFVKFSTLALASNVPDIVQKVDEVIKRVSNPRAGLDLTMLISLYFPELLPKLQSMFDAENNYSVKGLEIADAIQKTPLSDQTADKQKRWVAEWGSERTKLSNAVRCLQKELVFIAEKI